MPPERSAVRLDLLVSTARKQKIEAGGDPLQVICKTSTWTTESLINCCPRVMPLGVGAGALRRSHAHPDPDVSVDLRDEPVGY